MATNYTYYDFYHSGFYYVLKTKASNLQLISFRQKYGEDKVILDTPYYGMNTSFFELATSKILNIAYQNGSPVGPSNQGYTNQGCGTSIICWNGSKLKLYDNVQNGSSSYVPKGSGTWAQGGYNLNLCDSNWKNKFVVQGDGTLLDGGSPRTGILINENTNDVYLIINPNMNTTVEELRKAMMAHVGITEGGNRGAWNALLTDGGRSAQMLCPDISIQSLANRAVPQIIALKDAN